MTTDQLEGVYTLLTAEFKPWVANGATYAGRVRESNPEAWDKYQLIQDTMVKWLQARKSLQHLKDNAETQKIAGDLAVQGNTLISAVRGFNTSSWWKMKLTWIWEKLTIIHRVAWAVLVGVSDIFVRIGKQAMGILSNLPMLAVVAAGLWFIGPRLISAVPGAAAKR